MSKTFGISLLSLANVVLMGFVLAVPAAGAEEQIFRDCCKDAAGEGHPFPKYCCDSCCWFTKDCSGTLDCN